MLDYDDLKDAITPWRTAIIAGVILVILYSIVIKPYLRVWHQEQEGKATLARANQERQVLVTQAQAEREAATERAEAIKIIGEAAQKYPEYRQQEFMGAFAEAIQKENINQIIYVPTEANVPVTEAGRFASK